MDIASVHEFIMLIIATCR